MRCPSCASLDTQVKDSRPTEDSAVSRRRRVCLACNFRFTTFERVQLRELTVIKRNGRRVPFDRDKLMRSVQIALTRPGPRHVACTLAPTRTAPGSIHRGDAPPSASREHAHTITLASSHCGRGRP